MSNLVLRQNLSVLDRATYFTSLWAGEQTSSFNSSQARGWLTDLELVGTDGDKWSSVKVHKLVVAQVFPSLAEFLHENGDAKIVFPDVPTQVINSLIQLIYSGECPLSPVADVVAILRLANVLGLFIPPDRLTVCERELGSKNVKHAISNKTVPQSVKDSSSVKSVELSNCNQLISMADELPRVKSDQEKTGHVPKNDLAKLVHQKYSCEHCDFRCRFWVGLEEHANNVHKDKMFHCGKCEFGTWKLKNVKIHDKHIHTGIGSLICEVCGFKAKTASKLAWHENHLHNKSAIKDGKSAVSSTKSKKKVVKTLRVKRPLPADMLHCHVCDFKTFYKKSLAKHVLKFHES